MKTEATAGPVHRGSAMVTAVRTLRNGLLMTRFSGEKAGGPGSDGSGEPGESGHMTVGMIVFRVPLLQPMCCGLVK